RPELLLLQRTMLVVEGVSRSLDPRCNIWKAAEPIVGAWIRERLGPRQALADAREGLKILSRLGPRLPGVTEELVMLAEEARLKRLRGPINVRIRELPAPALARPTLLAFLVGAAAAALALRLLD
ncbi:MAG: hypothetical protein AAF899_13995, partial [Pseudomonadota bacterium]